MQADFRHHRRRLRGLALAARLSEDGKHSRDRHRAWRLGFRAVHFPDARKPNSPIRWNMGIYDWGYSTEPEPHLGNRRLAAPRGKVIGGIVLDQRHGVRARPCRGLQPLGRPGRHRLVVCRTCCPISSAWKPRTRTGRIGGEDGWRGTRRAAAQCNAGRRSIRCFQCVHTRVGRQGRLRGGDGGLQRVAPGRLRPDGADHPQGTALVGGPAEAYLKPALKRQNVRSRQRAWRAGL